MARRVWILGSGFSRSLGAPLLSDLLSDGARHAVRDRYPNVAELHTDLAGEIYGVFRQGVREFPAEPEHKVYRHGPRPALWSNAEAYLEFLDETAADDTKRRWLCVELKLLNSLKGNEPRATEYYRAETGEPSGSLEDIKRLPALAWKLVAAHCCAFLEPVTQDEILNLEKWAPYLRWLSRLTPADDTVVTFNYDRVLERLSEAACLDYITGFQIVANEDSEHRADGRRPLVLKLHGSVDWELIDGKQSGEWLFRSTRQADFAIHCPPERLAIAVPGRSKLPRSRSFDVLWRMAETAIQEAEEIYFLGYRFPPSDIEAQKRILGALAKARNVKIRVVLGKSHDDSARLKDLIEIYTDKTPRVFSLTAEEYIQAWSERA